MPERGGVELQHRQHVVDDASNERYLCHRPQCLETHLAGEERGMQRTRGVHCGRGRAARLGGRDCQSVMTNRQKIDRQKIDNQRSMPVAQGQIMHAYL